MNVEEYNIAHAVMCRIKDLEEKIEKVRCFGDQAQSEEDPDWNNIVIPGVCQIHISNDSLADLINGSIENMEGRIKSLEVEFYSI